MAKYANKTVQKKPAGPAPQAEHVRAKVPAMQGDTPESLARQQVTEMAGPGAGVVGPVGPEKGAEEKQQEEAKMAAVLTEAVAEIEAKPKGKEKRAARRAKRKELKAAMKPEGGKEKKGAGKKKAQPVPKLAAPAAAPAAPVEAPAAKTAAPEAPAKEKPAGPEGEKKEEGKKEEKEKALPKSPTSPDEDPAFQQTLKHVEASADAQSAHPDAQTKVDEYAAGATLPEADQARANAEEDHIGEMDGVAEKRKPFKPETFKELLSSNLEDLEKALPKDEDSAEEFKKEKPIEGIKDNIAGQVGAENEKLKAPLDASAKKSPLDPSEQPVDSEVPIEEQDPGLRPEPIDAKKSVPKPKYDHEISMEEESESLDDLMDEHDVTDDQLARSNEPKFTGALESKNQAQAEAANAPKVYRAQERKKLAAARAIANKHGESKLQTMFGARTGALGGVFSGQKATEKTDEEKQADIHAEFERMYNETKDAVTTKLDALTDTVEGLFETEAEAAKKTFEENVEEQIDDIYGFTVIDDWLFGADTEAIERVFVKEKARFVRTMDGILDRIAVIISDELNGALKLIKDGKTASENYYKGLDKEQQKLAEDSYEQFNDQYTDLEDIVYEKEEELASDLASAYKENVDSLRESFETIRDTVAAGWIGAAFQALWGVIKAIIKIYKLLFSLLAAVVEAIGAILSDPIGFLSNLIDGIQMGFNNFIGNIKTHIVTGLIEWLTGSLGGVGITLPENIFSLKGIFNLVLQIMGLTWDYFRNRAVKMLGEKVVGAMEYGVELFQKIRTDGIEAIWEEIKDKFQDLQVVVMDAIRDMVITKVIEAGIKWMMGLLNPAGAFIKAAMLIVDIARFFIERAEQIFELVTAFIDSIRALASGNVMAVANGIETALAKSIPILISFLAALVGVTGLTQKVTKIIKRIRKRINKAIDKVIKKARKIFKKGGKGSKKVTDKDRKNHKKVGESVRKELRKPTKKKNPSFDEFYAEKTKQAKSLEKKYQKKLRGNVKLTIKFDKLAKERKDNDIDFRIKIAPNDYSAIEEVGNLKGVNLMKLSVKEGPPREVKTVFQKKYGSLEAVDEKYPQAYLGQVIGLAESKKGRGITKLPMKYRKEAFADPDESQKRFSLVIGVNQPEDVAGRKAKQLQKYESKFSNKHKYPLGVVGLLWTPNWQKDEDGTKKDLSVEELRKEVNDIKDVKERKKIRTEIKKREDAIGGKNVPYGTLRDSVNNHAFTSSFSGALRNNASDVFVHIGDADAVSLKVKGLGSGADPGDIFKTLDKPLFNVYDEIINANKGPNGKPAIVTGGYRFMVKMNIGNADQLRAIANQIDQEYRQAAAKIDPSIMYFPEPNTLVKMVGDKLECSFGIAGNEGEKLVNELIKKRGLGKDDMVIDGAAAVTTGSHRFYAKLGGSKVEGKVLAYTGARSGGNDQITLKEFSALFKADQMLATKSKVVSRIKFNASYHPANGGNMREFSQILERIYVPLFPHTSILGPSLKGGGSGKWTNMKTDLGGFIVPDGENLHLPIVEYYKRNNLFDPAEQEGKALKIVQIMKAGAGGVHNYLNKLFSTVTPVP